MDEFKLKASYSILPVFKHPFLFSRFSGSKTLKSLGWLLISYLLFLKALPTSFVQAQESPNFNHSQGGDTQIFEQESLSNRNPVLSPEELEQTLLSLQLIERLGLNVSQDNSIVSLTENLTELKQSSQSVYPLSVEQTRQLQVIFSSLTAREILAINQLLLTQNPSEETELTPQEIQGLLGVLRKMPSQELTTVQQQQLQLIVEFLEELPQYRSFLLSSEQNTALSDAIALLFFSSPSPTPIASSPDENQDISPTPTSKSEAIVVTKAELQQIILTLQGIKDLNLRSPLQPLFNQLLSLLLTPDPEVTLSAQQNQTITDLLTSLSPAETERLNQYLASVQSEGEAASRIVYLSQAAIAQTLEFLNQLPLTTLTPSQQTARQELLTIFQDFAREETPAVALFPQQLQRINTLSARLPETTAPSSVEVEREQLETALNAVNEFPSEILSPEQQTAQNRLRELLESVLKTDGNEITLSRTQVREIALLRAKLPQPLPPGTALVQRDRVLTLLEDIEEASLTPEQQQQRQALQNYFQTRPPLNENTNLAPVETEKIEELTAFLETLDSSQLAELGGGIITGSETSIGAGISLETPTGFGGAPNSISVGALLQDRTRFTQSRDGSVGASISLGNPETAVGVTTSLAIFSLSEEGGSDAGFGDNGSLSFEINRNLWDFSSIGIGVENLVTWGVNDSGTSTYLAVSQALPLREDVGDPLGIAFVSAGLGNGRFRPEEDFDPFDDGTQFNFFGSVALQLIQRTNVIVEWSGQDLNLGLSIAPFANFPIVITPAVVDLTGSAGDGDRFTIGISYGTFF